MNLKGIPADTEKQDIKAVFFLVKKKKRIFLGTTFVVPTFLFPSTVHHWSIYLSVFHVGYLQNLANSTYLQLILAG